MGAGGCWTVKSGEAKARPDRLKQAGVAVLVFACKSCIGLGRTNGIIWRQTAAGATAYDGARSREGLIQAAVPGTRCGRAPNAPPWNPPPKGKRMPTGGQERKLIVRPDARSERLAPRAAVPCEKTACRMKRCVGVAAAKRPLEPDSYDRPKSRATAPPAWSGNGPDQAIQSFKSDRIGRKTRPLINQISRIANSIRCRRCPSFENSDQAAASSSSLTTFTSSG